MSENINIKRLIKRLREAKNDSGGNKEGGKGREVIGREVHPQSTGLDRTGELERKKGGREVEGREEGREERPSLSPQRIPGGDSRYSGEKEELEEEIEGLQDEIKDMRGVMEEKRRGGERESEVSEKLKEERMEIREELGKMKAERKEKAEELKRLRNQIDKDQTKEVKFEAELDNVAEEMEKMGGVEKHKDYQEETVSLHPKTIPGEDSRYAWEKEGGDEEEIDKEVVDLQYPLIPSEPEEDEKVYAWAHIVYDDERDELIYQVKEPELSDRNQAILAKVENRLKEKIDIDFDEMKEEEAREYLMEKIDEILAGRDFNLDQDTRDVIQYYAYRNFIGLGKIEPFMKDKYIEDISCDGVDIPVYVYHRNPEVASVRTDVKFEDEENLNAFVRKIAQRCGRSVSMAEPLVDGSLPDGSRVQATLATDIARRGSNFTIRRFTEEPLTPVDIIDFGTINAEMLAYLWLAIENGKSMLIAGPTAAGKTSLLNALSLFIPPEMKIISIEDTPELRLPHPNWVPEVARSGFGFSETEGGKVTLDDLLEESLRQRPDYIIVGEVRGEEAYVLFQQIATGHPGMSTLHASSLEKVMDRLTTKPINLPPSLVENLDIITFIKRVRRQGKYVRRVDAVYELEEFDEETEKPIVNQVFDWDASTDDFKNISGSSLLVDIADNRGVSTKKLQTEIERREKIIEWMADRDIDHYEDVGDITGNYYRNPKSILERIGLEV
ncbi:MAG: Flp pilus assembly complex ATPase component TadA [Candidatus Nanohaloarchaeota archaeon QJJ-7]|nr:Flp pilus assembly complex ATPase component TadA [Candidatus Nanohaloarchaeota archaeon QJJ-7]